MIIDVAEKVVDIYQNYRKRRYFKNEVVSIKKLFGGTVYNNPLVFILVFAHDFLYCKKDCVEPWQIDVFLDTRFTLNLPDKAEDILKLDPKTEAPILKLGMCGGKSCGKTFAVCIILLWLMFLSQNTKDVTFKAYSGKEDQLKTILLAKLNLLSQTQNLAKLFHRKNPSLKFYSKKNIGTDKPNELEDNCISCETWNVGNLDALSGSHSLFNIIIIDEAQSVADVCYPYFEGIFAYGISIMILTGNGTKPNCHFSKIVMSKNSDWKITQIDMDDCIRYSNERKNKIREGYESFEWKDAVPVFYHGMIGSGEINTFFDIGCINDCILRERDRTLYVENNAYTHIPVLGVDVSAGVDRDYTVISLLNRKNLEIMEFSNKLAPMEVVELIKDVYIQEHKGRLEVAIDADGMGLMVARDLQRYEIHCTMIHGGRKINNVHRPANLMPYEQVYYRNFKSMLYYRLKKWTQRMDTSIKSRCGDEVLKRLRKESMEIKFNFDEGLNISDKRSMTISPDVFDSMAYAMIRTEQDLGAF